MSKFHNISLTVTVFTLVCILSGCCCTKHTEQISLLSNKIDNIATNSIPSVEQEIKNLKILATSAKEQADKNIAIINALNAQVNPRHGANQQITREEQLISPNQLNADYRLLRVEAFHSKKDNNGNDIENSTLYWNYIVSISRAATGWHVQIIHRPPESGSERGRKISFGSNENGGLTAKLTGAYGTIDSRVYRIH